MKFLDMTEELRYYKLKYQMNRKLEEIVLTKGYVQIEPQFFEEYDSFIQMNKRIKKESTVKLLDSDGKILILRPDITTSIIKHVIPKLENQSQLKLFYLSTIFSRNAKHAIEEKKQFGIEFLGDASKEADLEVLNIAFSILMEFKVNFLIEINNNKFLSALMDELKLNEDLSIEFKNIVYYKNQHALNQFISRSEIPASYQDLVKNLLKFQGTISQIKEMLSKYQLTNPMRQAMTELEDISKALETAHLSFAKFDLSVISQYDYYAGITFKAFIQGVSSPIISGGRYDLLTKQLGKDVPAVGFALNSADLLKEVLRNHE